MGIVTLLVHREQQRFVELVNALLAHVVGFDLLNQLLHARFVQDLHEAVVLRHSALGLIELDPDVVVDTLFIVSGERLLGLGYELVHDARLIPTSRSTRCLSSPNFDDVS